MDFRNIKKTTSDATARPRQAHTPITGSNTRVEPYHKRSLGTNTLWVNARQRKILEHLKECTTFFFRNFTGNVEPNLLNEELPVDFLYLGSGILYPH